MPDSAGSSRASAAFGRRDLGGHLQQRRDRDTYDGTNTITLNGVNVASLTAGDFLFS